MDLDWANDRPIGALAFNATGDRLYVSNLLDTASYIWPDRTLEKVRRGEARSFAPHPDGQLVARGMKATVELYGEFKKKRVATCKNTAADSVPSMVWVDGNLVCAALGKGLAKIYDHAGAKLTALKAKGRYVWSVASDGSDIALMGETLRVYDAATYALKSESDEHDAKALGLDFDGRGGIIAAAIDGRVLRFDAAGTLLMTTESPFGHLRTVLVTDDQVWVAGNEGIARATLDTFIAGTPFDEVVRTDRPEGRGRWYAAPTGLARHPTTPLLAMGGSQQPLFFDLSADALVE